MTTTLSHCETLVERAAVHPGRIDRQRSIIFGVKVLGRTSKNGRTYTAEAMRRAIPMYEGRPVNIDHPNDLARGRSYLEKIGVLRNVRMEGDGLKGDLHLNPHHKHTEQVLWDAEHAPSSLGLSHNATGKTRREGRDVVVEEITAVRSVDIVAEPATTAGLFEHAALVESRNHGQQHAHRQFVESIGGRIPDADGAKSFARSLRG